MVATDKTPLWLDLKKKYIDDNFTNLIDYLKKSSNGNKDSFYNTTIELLRSRVEDLINSLSLIPLYKEDRGHKEINFNVQLLASYLLVDTDHPLALSAYIAFMSELRLLNPRLSDKIINGVLNYQKDHMIPLLHEYHKNNKNKDCHLANC